jgi:hypothetical protein
LGDQPLTKEGQNRRLASVALANIWFENEGTRFHRSSAVDPWSTFDNFRINHRARRIIHLQEGDNLVHKLKVEYLSENKFNVYVDKDKHGLEEPECILSHAEIIINPERPGEMLIRTDTEQFPVPYMLDQQTNEVFCLDSEGAPLKLQKKKDEDAS